MAISTKGFSIVHVNIRSLLRHKDELQSELDGHDIIAITETCLTPRATDHLLTMNNYGFIKQDRTFLNENNATKKGGGILIYFKNVLEPYMLILKNSVCNMHSEELWITIKKPGRKILTLGVVYR